MVKQMIEERRQFVRARRILSVRHRLHMRRGRPMHEFWYLSTTEDMSANGLLFTSAMPYQKSDIIEIEVVLSGVLDIFRGFGRVARVSKKESGAFYNVAVQYVDVKGKPQVQRSSAFPRRRSLTVKRAMKRK